MDKKYIALSLLCLSLCAASACTPKAHEPLTFEQQEAERAKTQCQQEASDMVDDGPQNSDNPLWANYFEMCMHRMGITDAELKKMWY